MEPADGKTGLWYHHSSVTSFACPPNALDWTVLLASRARWPFSGWGSHNPLRGWLRTLRIPLTSGIRPFRHPALDKSALWVEERIGAGAHSSWSDLRYPDGGNIRQISFGGDHATPTVCEGGQSVVYSASIAGPNHLWRLDMRGGTPVKLTNGQGETNPACDAAGRWVFYWGQAAGGPFVRV
jgi:hypothetical protein